MPRFLIVAATIGFGETSCPICCRPFSDCHSTGDCQFLVNSLRKLQGLKRGEQTCEEARAFVLTCVTSIEFEAVPIPRRGTTENNKLGLLFSSWSLIPQSLGTLAFI